MAKTDKKQRGPRRHIPQRICVGCRVSRSKRDLIRLVRTPENIVEIDITGKRPGRGAYLCRQRGCWESALERGSLGRALKIRIDEATRLVLGEYAQGLPESLEVAQDDIG